MPPKFKHILITGSPGVGKTTLIKKLSKQLGEFNPTGFYTAEIREKGTRQGFELISMDGKKSPLAHVDIKSTYRVGKYGVDMNSFEKFLDLIPFLKSPNPLIIIDEIGKMEIFSKKFRDLIFAILESDKILLATISKKDNMFIQRIKQWQGVKLMEITMENRDDLFPKITEEAKGILNRY